MRSSPDPRTLRLVASGVHPSAPVATLAVTFTSWRTDMRRDRSRALLPPLISLLLCALAALRPALAAPPAEEASMPVGLQTLAFEDPARQNWSGTGARPLSAVLWYPADPAAHEVDMEIGIFRVGRTARDAVVSPKHERYPLILLSHGTGGAAAGVSWLARALAAQGYVVAAPNHHGNTGAEPVQPLQGTLIWWDRPRDLSVLLDRLLAHPQWGRRIDPTRIGVGGFSIGGYSALASVGTRLSRAAWRDYCADPRTAAACALPPEVAGRYTEADLLRLTTQDARVVAALATMEDDYADPRVRAAFVMAPVVGPAMTRASLAHVRRPVSIVVGAEDDQAVPAANAVPIAAALAHAHLEVLPRVTHYTFLPGCTERGQLAAARLCTDLPGVDRDAVHRQVAARALQFFDQTLSPAD